MLERILKKLHLWGTYRKLIMYRVNVLLAGTAERSFDKKRMLLNRLDNFQIGEGTRIVGPIECYGKLTVGKNCWIGKNFRINGNGHVLVGDNCDIGPEVTFQTGSHEIGDTTRRAGTGMVFHQSVGNGTWIGGRSTILNNTTIGEGCVIAGCACVTKNVPPNTMAGGVPARNLRDL